MARTLRMFIDYLWISSIISKRVPTKKEQYIEKQSLLEIVHRRHLLKAVNKYKLIKEKS